MSKRLQVVVPDDEYATLRKAARARKLPVARLVRDAIRHSLATTDSLTSDKRIAAVLRFTRFAGPTGDIVQMLAEIEKGRGG